ncbi:hypothetical protein JAAARDRAFT_59631 [Jaapia argillacea MUCL 33604]|uniref:Secreted protein n=1 Tax=Jaapia argillacea MUCL 33604 TaxID=933084 RepID=A0A067PPA1_9AGAM|nr:hypothetical protein JAAARDRAFT_59631 [Jaapia argillacea MUCL 33604]
MTRWSGMFACIGVPSFLYFCSWDEVTLDSDRSTFVDLSGCLEQHSSKGLATPVLKWYSNGYAPPFPFEPPKQRPTSSFDPAPPQVTQTSFPTFGLLAESLAPPRGKT